MIRALVLMALISITLTAGAADWPAWRGPDGQGHCTETGLPIKWSATDNVKWKTPLPDEGNSTPIIHGNRIYLTQAIGKGPNSKRMLWCLDRATGKKLWEQGVTYADKESTHGTNPYCSASPVTDGERVVVSYGSAGMVCYDMDGKELWKKDLGKLEHQWGNASSPILYKDLAILWCGPGNRQFLLAVDKKTGKEVWTHDEPGGNGKAFIGSWSTPIIARVNGTDQLILGVPNKLKGFDPNTGKELWWCGGLSALVYTSPLYANGIAVQMCGYGGPALAVKLGGTGDITKDRLWLHPRNTQRVGSGIIVGEHIYIIEENGQPHCYELKTGNEVWKAGERQLATTWSSMVHADGKLYVASHSGDTVVLKAEPKLERLAKNSLGERVLSSVAVANGELFIRSYKHLWCISEKK
jgi:outer membrane protein assembly factor BamB